MDLLGELLGWIPNLIVAALIVIVGWFIARIVQRIATSFFAALGADKLSDRVGLSKYMGKMTLSALIGMVVFVLIMIPIIIAALEALRLAALTAPLVAMLTAVMVAIPVVHRGGDGHHRGLLCGPCGGRLRGAVPGGAGL